MRRHRLQRVRVVAGVVLLIGSVAGLVWGAQDNEDVGSTPTTRPRALQGATVPLERGLAASECAGTPLSAMFEVAERKRQLAVYTRQGNTFSEVIVDGTTGKITKVEALTRGAELTAAIAQGAVMVKAKTSLRTAVGGQEDRGDHNMRNHNANLMEDAGMRKNLVFGLAVVSVWLLGGLLVSAQDTHEKAHAELAKALPSAKVSLADGLTASAHEGTPISGKFELEEGKLQLSVYTMKGDTFSEVIVDHSTGKIAKAEPITSGEDYTAATAQRAAMTKAKQSLQTVVDTVVKAHPGMHAVSVFPALKGEHAVADITLAKDGTFTTVSESLE